MKVPFTLGEVGHFGLAVRDPKKSAKWFERALGLRKEFEFENHVTCVAHGQVPALTRYLRVLTFSSTTKMNTFASENGDGKEFVSHAPGYWPTRPELWNDWKWQLKNGSPRSRNSRNIFRTERRGTQRRFAVRRQTRARRYAALFQPDPRENPDDPIRRQVIPRIEETWASPYDMADPCGEDSHMPVPGWCIDIRIASCFW
jgi:catechol 2,3-dioxygenase-like lactoylglutathione lyase family enzyme